MERGTKARLARVVQMTPSHIGDILNGKHRPSPATAAKLEAATGIDRLAWLYPDDFRNELIEEARARK